jgi:DHA2 family multidrug resistance protein
MASARASTAPAEPAPLQGIELVLAGLLLAVANFIVVLDTTIANVSVPHIAGGLAVSTNEGTYVITSYAVAEAIIVPLTGWLSKRFGTVRVFSASMMLFGLFSVLCGLSASLGFLVAARIFQGLSGGPLMPLSQTLLMQIFPPKKRGAAIGLWSMTTLVAPVMGPIVGGYICDHWHWSLIFFINLPIAVICGIAAARMLRRFESKTLRERVDFVGLGLMILWVGALQLMLDEGKKLDWFASTEICVLAIVAAIGLVAFLIWELTEANPIIDLRVFRHRGFTASVITISLAFGAFFGTVVLMPLWLQSFMGYTATDSGFVSASIGITAVFVAPIAAGLSQKMDPRKLVFCGVAWLGIMTFVRSYATTDMTMWDISWPMLLQGLGMPFFFVPLTALALASVDPHETASAAGLMSFLRTLSGAFATSIVTTSWENEQTVFRSDLVERAQSSAEVATLMGDLSPAGMESALQQLNLLIQQQAVVLATNHVLHIVSFTFIFAALAIWLAPKPTRQADLSAAH